MQPDEAAAATLPAVVTLPSHFMLDMGTYGIGADLGFEGLDFYVGGRGGVLGDTPGMVVAAALVFWEPSNVVANWAKAGDVMPRADASRAFADCGAQWGRDHLSDDVDHERLADLAGRIIEATNPAGAPLFAGWRELPLPEDAKGRALHQLNVLRELRGAYHGAAVLAAGIPPDLAVRFNTPGMIPIFGWVESDDDGEAVRDAWVDAELVTNRMLGNAFAALPEAQLDEFVALALAAVETAAS